MIEIDEEIVVLQLCSKFTSFVSDCINSLWDGGDLMGIFKD